MVAYRCVGSVACARTEIRNEVGSGLGVFPDLTSACTPSEREKIESCCCLFNIRLVVHFSILEAWRNENWQVGGVTRESSVQEVAAIVVDSWGQSGLFETAYSSRPSC